MTQLDNDRSPLPLEHEIFCPLPTPLSGEIACYSVSMSCRPICLHRG